MCDDIMMMLNIMSKASNTLSVGEETDSVVGVRTSIRLEQARTSGSFQVTDWFSNFDTTSGDVTSESEDPQPARGGLSQISRGRHDQPRHGGGWGHGNI